MTFSKVGLEAEELPILFSMEKRKIEVNDNITNSPHTDRPLVFES